MEGLVYQGQMASRMEIIFVAYIQQALCLLLNSINNGQGNMDSITNSLRDIFSMATKSLDQLGRTGAFHHLIGRKATAQDSDLITLKDIHNKIVCLPLYGRRSFWKEEKREAQRT